MPTCVRLALAGEHAMTNPSNRSVERLGFTALVACLLAPFVAQGLLRPLEHVFGATSSAPRITTTALALGLAAGLFAWLPARLPPAFDGLARRHRGLTAIYVLFALVSVVSVARVSVFVDDPTAVQYQAVPGERFTEVHSCLSAYARALDLAREGVDDLYADRWWYGSLGLPPLPEGVESPYLPFELDNFNYPPTFLVLASPLALLEGDFLAQRSLWFGLNGLVAALGLWVVARWVEGPAAHRALLLAPLFLGSLPVLVVLQVGNFHNSALVLAVLAMVALEQRRAATGGALLASAILSKISPGVLGIVLLVQRRAREAALTAGFGVALLALSLVLFGTNPIRSFVHTALPHLSSGAAFPFMETPDGIATNMSPFGFAFKLKILGFDVGDPWRVGPWVSRVYTLGLLALTIVSARRRGDRRDQAIRWMALLVLGAMQSPFSPAYSTLGLLWATTLLSVEVRRWRHALALVALWPAVLFVPSSFDLAMKSVLSMAQTALILGTSAWLALRAPPSNSMGENR